MRCFLTVAILAATAWPAAAQQNEAEKLFRDMVHQVRTAKTLQLRFDADITGADGKSWRLKGALTLGEGDKLWADSEGTLFGEESKFTIVSDGTNLKSSGYTKTPGEPRQKSREIEWSPKGLGGYFRSALPRDGLFACVLNADLRSKKQPDIFQLSDFKFAADERIGGHDTRVVQYSVRSGPADANPISMKVWLDAKTKLPVRLAMTRGNSDIKEIVETYSEFNVDVSVDEKRFELPK